MKRIELRRIRILKRVFNSSVATSFAKTFGLVNSETHRESDSQVYPEGLTEPYICYEELTRVRLQLLELERQKAEALSFAHRSTYM